MNDNTSKPLPKSLHTITAIQRVAMHLITSGPSTVECTAETMAEYRKAAVRAAVSILGYGASPDPDNLAGKALAAWEKSEAEG